jgi:hypothetical protein
MVNVIKNHAENQMRTKKKIKQASGSISRKKCLSTG